MRPARWTAPAVVVLVLLLGALLGRTVWTALHRSNLTAPSRRELVGLDNLTDVVTNRGWWLAVATTLLVVAAVVAVQLVAGIVLASALHRVTRAWPVARFAALVPLALLSVVSVVAWRDAVTTGYLATWFDLGDAGPFAQLVAVSVGEAWRGLGLVVVVMVLALGAVPRSLLDSAVADGATRWQRWRHVVAPSIGPAVAAITAFRVFDTFRVLDGPLLVDAPGASVRTAPVLLWNTQLTDFELGLGAAMSLVLLAVAVLLAALVVPLLRVRRAVL